MSKNGLYVSSLGDPSLHYWRSGTTSSTNTDLCLDTNEYSKYGFEPAQNGILCARLLDDKQHAVAVTNFGQCLVVDIPRMVVVRIYRQKETQDNAKAVVWMGRKGKKWLDRVFELENERVQTWTATWCQVSARLGLIVVTLEKNKYMEGEAYYDTLRLSTQPEARLNLGDAVLRALFKNWGAVDPSPVNSSQASPVLSREDGKNELNSIPNSTSELLRQQSTTSVTLETPLPQQKPPSHRPIVFNYPPNVELFFQEPCPGHAMDTTVYRGFLSDLSKELKPGNSVPSSAEIVHYASLLDAIPPWVYNCVVKVCFCFGIFTKFKSNCFFVSRVNHLQKMFISSNSFYSRMKIAHYQLYQMGTWLSF